MSRPRFGGGLSCRRDDGGGGRRSLSSFAVTPTSFRNISGPDVRYCNQYWFTITVIVIIVDLYDNCNYYFCLNTLVWPVTASRERANDRDDRSSRSGLRFATDRVRIRKSADDKNENDRPIPPPRPPAATKHVTVIDCWYCYLSFCLDKCFPLRTQRCLIS